MQILPVDIIELAAVVLGISVVLVPVIGLTARYALSPTVEALVRLFDTKSTEETVRLLERRLELQEQEIALLNQTMHALSDARDFDRKLQAPQAGGSSEPSSP